MHITWENWRSVELQFEAQDLMLIDWTTYYSAQHTSLSCRVRFSTYVLFIKHIYGILMTKLELNNLHSIEDYRYMFMN